MAGKISLGNVLKYTGQIIYSIICVSVADDHNCSFSDRMNKKQYFKEIKMTVKINFLAWMERRKNKYLSI